VLGKIIGIDENQVLLKIEIDLSKYASIIGNHVVLEDQTRICVGEIVDIKDEIAYINLLGELINNKFVYGVIGKPSFGAVTKIVSKEKVPLIISEENTEENKFLCLGKSALYSGVDVNQFAITIPVSKGITIKIRPTSSSYVWLNGVQVTGQLSFYPLKGAN
jgi:hypothetical protein